ncbi:thioredoxin family protein [Gelidibacter salicanalis]|uniref:Thioredoxin family protein n=1 Tax=Gelidibacter salicanalis TaxID=291193 RepID=A0A934KTU6_9FLAO|nr:thioredoxin family protein [Gelidibacter salicanalis]MBJ7880073.1 thioredoxin family protein [Gelidibacter salicanalis]
MDTITHNINNILKTSLNSSMFYADYRSLMGELVETHSTTGLDPSVDMVGYTILNEQRMKRWDKTLKVSVEAQEKIASFKGDVTWLVLTESWCGDAAHVIPVINKVAELSPNIDLKLVVRDENEDLMQQFLTNGGKSIPKLIMIDNGSGEVLDTFGPRPTSAAKLVEDYKAEHGMITEEFKEILQAWYNKDKGQNTIEDLLTILGVS